MYQENRVWINRTEAMRNTETNFHQWTDSGKCQDYLI